MPRWLKNMFTNICLRLLKFIQRPNLKYPGSQITDFSRLCEKQHNNRSMEAADGSPER